MRYRRMCEVRPGRWQSAHEMGTTHPKHRQGIAVFHPLGASPPFFSHRESSCSAAQCSTAQLSMFPPRHPSIHGRTPAPTLVALSASSTRSFFSLSSVSVWAPTYTDGTEGEGGEGEGEGGQAGHKALWLHAVVKTVLKLHTALQRSSAGSHAGWSPSEGCSTMPQWPLSVAIPYAQPSSSCCMPCSASHLISSHLIP